MADQKFTKEDVAADLIKIIQQAQGQNRKQMPNIAQAVIQRLKGNKAVR